MKQKKMTKSEWDALRYPIELQPLSEEEGGGWAAWIPMLGKGLFMADADTPQEAIEALESLRREKYETVIASSQPIPLPEDVTDLPRASGRWLQRTLPALHAELKQAAEKAGVSFNSYVEHAILKGHLMGTAEQEMSRTADDILRRAGKSLPKAS